MNKRLPVVLSALLLFAATVVLFAPSVTFSLVNFDDPVFIVHNPIVLEGFSLHAIGSAFSSLHGDRFMYVPLLWISYLADTALFGASPASPWGFHLSNVLLHATNAVLLFFVLRLCTRHTLPALLAAAFWALHPLRVESVAWVTERKDTLSTLFAFLSILFYLKAWERGRPARDGGSEAAPAFLFSLFTFHCRKGRLCFALAAFAAGLLSKPMLVTLPFLFLLFDYWPLRRFSLRGAPRALFRLALEKWPFFLLSAVFSIATRHLQTAAISQATLFHRICWLPSNYLFYLSKTVWPSALTPMSPGFSVTPTFLAVATTILLALAAIAALLLRRTPGFPVGLLAFAGLLFPVSGIVLIGMVPVADRYSYLPAIGLSIALVALLDHFRPPRPARSGMLHAALCISLAALAAVTARLLPAWHDSDTLHDRIAAIHPGNYVVLDYRFSQAFDAGDLPAAANLADRLFAVRPTNAHSVYAKTIVLSQTASSAEALAFHDAHRPTDALLDARISLPLLLAVLAADAQDPPTAAANLQTARANSLGDDASAQMLDLFAGWLDDTLAAGPSRPPEERFLSATAVWALGLRRQALPSFLQIAREASSNAALLNNVAWLLASTPGSPADQADILAIARRAVDLAPDNPVLRDTLAVALAFAGQFEKAVALESAVADSLRNSSSPDAPALLADILARLDLFQRRLPYTESASNRLLVSP